MVAGLAADRNRRPPTALVLAEGLETIVRQMEPRSSGGPSSAAGADRPAEATVVTNPNRPPAPMTTPLGYQSLPPGAVPTPPSTLEPEPAPLPEPQPTYAGSLPPTYAPVPYTAPTPTPVTATMAEHPRRAPRRSTSYYVLLGIAALALFAISMFVTILLLHSSTRAGQPRGELVAHRADPQRGQRGEQRQHRHRADHRAEGDREVGGGPERHEDRPGDARRTGRRRGRRTG